MTVDKWEWIRKIYFIKGSCMIAIPPPIIHYWRLHYGIEEIEEVKVVFDTKTKRVYIEPAID